MAAQDNVTGFAIVVFVKDIGVDSFSWKRRRKRNNSKRCVVGPHSGNSSVLHKRQVHRVASRDKDCHTTVRHLGGIASKQGTKCRNPGFDWIEHEYGQ
jgi:hypothetical protein